MTRVLLILLLLTIRLHGATQVTLAWDPSPDTNVAGYYLCYGTSSGSYTQTNTVNAQTLSNRVEGLTAGVTYYFSVAAFDASGTMSDFSNEVTWTGEQALQLRRKIKIRFR